MSLPKMKRFLRQVFSVRAVNDEVNNNKVTDDVMESLGLFDQDWYKSQIIQMPEDAGKAPEIIFMSRGLASGHAPLPELKVIYALRNDAPQDPLDQYKRLVRAVQPWWKLFGRGRFGILLALFSPYVVNLGLDTQSDDAVERLIAFLEAAWTDEIDPGPLFCAKYYRQVLHDRGLVLQNGETGLQHFLREGFDSHIVPTRCFNGEYYYKLYPELARTGFWPFEHFMRWGYLEGRIPNEFFDPAWYESQIDHTPDEAGRAPYVIFMSRGITAGHAPLPELEMIYATRRNVPGDARDQYGRLIAAMQPWHDRFGRGRLGILLALFSPYAVNLGLDTQSDDAVERLIAFLEAAWTDEIDPGPLFCAKYYRQVLHDRGLVLQDGETGLQHFLREGFDSHIVPTRCFNGEYYYKLYPELAGTGFWPFEHFMRWGYLEGRIPNEFFDPAWYESQIVHTPDEVGRAPYVIFMSRGITAGHAPLPELEMIYATRRNVPVDVRDQYGRLIAAMQPWHDRFGRGRLGILLALFSPYDVNSYLDTQSDDAVERLIAFLEAAWTDEIDPGPLFYTKYYRQALHDRGLVLQDGETGLQYFLRDGFDRRIVPTPCFDEKYYSTRYRDLAASGLWLFEHFIRWGYLEGRIPNEFFDPAWYESQIDHTPDEVGRAPYVIFMSRGITAGHAPLPELEMIYATRRNVPGDAHDQYGRLLAAMQPWHDRFGRGRLGILLALFSPYDVNSYLDTQSDDAVERLIAFLEAAWTDNVDPSPLFYTKYYRQVLHEQGLILQDGETGLQHFLRDGFDRRIVPTPCFDEKYYSTRYWDLAASGLWLFEHFMRWGMFEGRRAFNWLMPVLGQIPELKTNQDRAIQHWKYFLLCCVNRHIDPRPPRYQFDELYQKVQQYSKVIDDIIHSPVFAETLRRTAQIEPAVGDVSEISDVLVPPLHDACNLARKTLRTLLGGKHYDSIVCVPWIRTGGADLVACQICEALRLARPDESVLLLRTDLSNFDRPEWVPISVDVVDASKVFRNISPINAQILLYGVFMGIAPKRVINVNSRLCWETMARFGARLGQNINLYAYLFCWDQNANGYRSGYPSEFFPDTVGSLRAVFTDTVYLKNELLKIYNMPKVMSDCIVPLFSPSYGQIDGPTKMEESIGKTGKRNRYRILWAGRLDRQKRFDLVQEIARRIPEADFLCWGTPLLDAPPDHSRSPNNLILNDCFNSYDDLPLDTADLWLFTSAWEGMPTILIELAQRGMSIVASAVGGVPEMIDEKTGWPVIDIDNIDAYVNQIRSALEAPEERVARARQLRERVRARHSMAAYVMQISEVLEKETRA